MVSKDSSDPPHLLREGLCANIAGWSKRLDVEETQIDSFLAQGILRRQSGATGNSILRLDFVGLLSTGNRTFFSLPKVYLDLSLVENGDLKRAVGTVHTYHKKLRRGPEAAKVGAAEFFDSAGALLDLFIALLQWTEEHGLHTAEADVFSAEFAHINWQETIQATFPAHQKSSVVYVEPRGRRTRMALTEMAEIQALALLDLKAHLGVLADLWLGDYEPLTEDCRALAEESTFRLEEMHGIRAALSAVAFSAVRDPDKDLLALLNQWLDGNFGKPTRPHLYGTTAFHTVWEDMCLTFLGGSTSAESHSAFASQPRYFIHGHEWELGPQRPDYLRREGNAIWLADAKWYRAEQGELPMLGDVIKQLMYQLSVTEDLEVRSNCFFLPHLGEPLWKDAGNVRMQRHQLPDERFPEVRLISVDWNAAADAYVQARPVVHWLEILGEAE